MVNITISDLILKTEMVIDSCNTLKQLDTALTYSGLVIAHIQNNNCSYSSINAITAYFKSKTDNKYLELLNRS